MSETSTLIGNQIITRDQLALIPTPTGTLTHRPIPHIEIVETLLQNLAYRHITVVREDYTVDSRGAKMFGVLDLSLEYTGVRLSIGLRNSHDKSMALGVVVGYRVFVCSNMAFNGDFEPVLAKHSKNFNLLNTLSIAVDNMQRNFEPLQKQISAWRENSLTDNDAKLMIYRAFIEGDLDVARHLARPVHELYFSPKYEEFQPRTVWSLSNAFTSAFKALDPTPQFQATAKLGEFLKTRTVDAF